MRDSSPLQWHLANQPHDFADFIATKELEGETLVFGIFSLFTNIPTDLAVNAAFRRLSVDNTLGERTDLSVHNITFRLCLCLPTFLSFQRQYYLPAGIQHRNGVSSINQGGKSGEEGG